MSLQYVLATAFANHESLRVKPTSLPHPCEKGPYVLRTDWSELRWSVVDEYSTEELANDFEAK